MTIASTSTNPDQALLEHIQLIAGIGEKLSEQNNGVDSSLKEHAHFLCVRISETYDLDEIERLALLGLDCASSRSEDVLADEITFLFGQIVEELRTRRDALKRAA